MFLGIRNEIEKWNQHSILFAKKLSKNIEYFQFRFILLYYYLSQHPFQSTHPYTYSNIFIIWIFYTKHYHYIYIYKFRFIFSFCLSILCILHCSRCCLSYFQFTISKLEMKIVNKITSIYMCILQHFS